MNLESIVEVFEATLYSQSLYTCRDCGRTIYTRREACSRCGGSVKIATTNAPVRWEEFG
jgi:uncharacterized OB-fold protein